MDNKRKAILIIGIILLIGAFIALVVFFKPSNPQEKIKKTALEYIQKWGDFDNQADPKYLDSLKPYETSSFHKKQIETAESVKKMQQGYEPTGSLITINRQTMEIEKEGKDYIVAVKINRELQPKEMNLKYTEEITVKFIQDKKGWLVDDISSKQVK